MSVPALAFLLTLALEWPFVFWLSPAGTRWRGLFFLCMNGASWGLAMGSRASWPAIPVAALEVVIILAEGILLAAFWRGQLARALMLSLLANLASWQLGRLILPRLMGWV